MHSPSMHRMGKSFGLDIATSLSQLDASVRSGRLVFSRLNALTLPTLIAQPFSRLNAGNLRTVPAFSRLNARHEHPDSQRYGSPWSGPFSRLNGPRSQTPKENAPVTLGRFLLWPLNRQERQ
jgi:hypothetical protein